MVRWVKWMNRSRFLFDVGIIVALSHTKWTTLPCILCRNALTALITTSISRMLIWFSRWADDQRPLMLQLYRCTPHTGMHPCSVLSLTLSPCTLAGPVYTGMPLVDPVYTGIPLGDPANTCRVHWNTTGWTCPILECNWRNSEYCSLHWNPTGWTIIAHTHPGTYS